MHHACGGNVQGNVGMSMGNERVRNVTETLAGFTHGIRNGRKLGEKGSKGTIRNGRGGVAMMGKEKKLFTRGFANAVIVMEVGVKKKIRNDRNVKKMRLCAVCILCGCSSTQPPPCTFLPCLSVASIQHGYHSCVMNI